MVTIMSMQSFHENEVQTLKVLVKVQPIPDSSTSPSPLAECPPVSCAWLVSVLGLLWSALPPARASPAWLPSWQSALWLSQGLFPARWPQPAPCKIVLLEILQHRWAKVKKKRDTHGNQEPDEVLCVYKCIWEMTAHQQLENRNQVASADRCGHTADTCGNELKRKKKSFWSGRQIYELARCLHYIV